MRRLFKPLFFVASFMMCCLLFNCEKVFAATTTDCSKENGYCNICHETSCNHVVGRTYDNVVYYFYDGGHGKYIEWEIKQLKLSGEVNENYLVPICVTEPNSFKLSWNSMGYYNGKECCIRAVIIQMHGKAEENVIGSESGINNNGGLCITQGDINALDKKPVQRLVLLTCYGAYQYFNDRCNVAKLFSNRIKQGEVIAGSAKVYLHELVKWNRYDNEGIASIYYVYYVAVKEVIVDGVYTPSDTYNDGYNWILYKEGECIKVCSGDCYSINGLLVIGQKYEEEEE